MSLLEECPDCKAPAGVECDWACSSNWRPLEEDTDNE